jgi:hypothetical protein
MSKQYYVYYDNKTKNILSVTNEEDPSYETGIKAEFNEIKNFLNGQWHFKDFLVDYIAGTSDLAIISTVDQSINFENNEFDLIVSKDEDAEFIVEYNIPNRSWYFQLDPVYKTTVKGVFNSKMSFFVTLESDHDFLIRTITIDADQLLANYHICVPFEEPIEQDLSKISISTRMIFKNYKLKVVHEN